MLILCRGCAERKSDSEFLHWPCGRRQTRCYICCLRRALRRSEKRVKGRGGVVDRFSVGQLVGFWAEFGVALGHCYYCGVYLMELAPDKTTIEHVTPVSEGGSHALYNLVPACADCNIAACGWT